MPLIHCGIKWIIISILLGNYLITIALLVWCIFILWKDWNAPYIVKRSRILVVLLLSMLFLGILTASLWIPAKFFKIKFKLAPNLRFVSEIPFVLITWNFLALDNGYCIMYGNICTYECIIFTVSKN